MTDKIEHLGRYQVRLYCENSDCPVREMDLTLKCDDAEDLSRFEAARRHRTMACPVCGTQNTSVHFIRDAAEQELEAHRSAVGLVNADLWQRDHGPGVPVSVLCLNELPKQWKAVE